MPSPALGLQTWMTHVLVVLILRSSLTPAETSSKVSVVGPLEPPSHLDPLHSAALATSDKSDARFTLPGAASAR